MNLPIRIMTREFQLLDEIKLYSSLQIIRSWHGVGYIDLRINRYLKGADKLLRGHIIFPHNHTNKGYVIRHKEIELDENGKATENWIVRAQSLKSWLAERLTNPPVGKAQDAITADAETVMRHYVHNNAINPLDPNDIIPDLVMDENLHRGEQIEWQSRYKVLSGELETISMLSGLGWNVEIDLENKQYVFKVLEGRSLVESQSDLPPAIFSPEFGTLKQLKYVESELEYKNFAVVAGQGEGVERRIVTVGDAVGADRRVLFVDARDIAEETEDGRPIPVEQIEEALRQRGLQKLAEHQQELFLEGQVLMGRIEERVPQKVEGVAGDVRLDEVDLWEHRNLLIIRNAKENTLLAWANGRESGEVGALASDFIAVSKGSEILSSTSTSQLFYYDVDKAFIPLGNMTGGRRFIVPTDDRISYMRVTYRGNILAGGKKEDLRIKVELGPTATPWQPAPEDNIPWYQPTKTVELAPINLSRLGRYQSSRFTFNVSAPPGISAIVEYSLDNQTWNPLQSGDSLPFNEGDWLTNTVVYLRQRLSTLNQAVTPSISGFKYEINGYTIREKISTARLEYEKDYDLGDIGTLQNKDWDVTLDARITEVKEIYEPGKTGIELTFDNERPTLISKIKQELAGMKNEIVR